MRWGVVDIGSNTVHVLVADAVAGRRPVEHVSDRTVVRLMQYLAPDGSIDDRGVAALLDAVGRAREVAEHAGVDELVVMATSALREATNGAGVLAAITDRLGAPVQVLSGPDEARLTFLAARRWHGWAAGRIVLLDIGGGSLEIAVGADEVPELAISVPLGAGRLTRELLSDDPPTTGETDAVRARARELLAPVAAQFRELEPADHAVATSKTFRSLARLAGVRLAVVGPDERWRMRRDQLSDWVPRLGRIPADGRTALPGITPERTYQIVAGAVVAEEAMKALRIDEVEICPWALREGVLLRRLDQVAPA